MNNYRSDSAPLYALIIAFAAAALALVAVVMVAVKLF
jgi:hypothetical protein